MRICAEASAKPIQLSLIQLRGIQSWQTVCILDIIFLWDFKTFGKYSIYGTNILEVYQSLLFHLSNYLKEIEKFPN